MKNPFLLMSVATASALFGAARPLSVGVPDSSGNVTVTIGGTGSGDQALIAAWANGDKGDDPLDWAEYADAGTVAASDASKMFQIPAAWRAKSGAVKFFLMSGPKPYGTRYDYITRPDCNNGGLYINTGIVPDPTVDISVKFQSPQFSSGAMVPFGIHKAVTMFSVGSDNENYYFYFFGAGNPRHPSLGMQLGQYDTNVFGDGLPKDHNPHTFRMSRNGIWIDGYRRVGPFNSEHFTNTTTSTIALFGRQGSWKQAGTTCSIYSATIITNGVLAADFVPVAAPSGYVQMWNRVTRQYHARSGSQKDSLTFVAGNDIGPYPPDCGTVESVSAALGLGPEMSVLSRNRQDCAVTLGLSASHDAGLLFACSGKEDAGTACSAWTTNILVQKVAADAANVTVALPDSWWREKRQVRFAWKSLAGPYDYDVAYLHSDRSGGATNFCRTGWIPTTNTSIHVTAKTPANVCSFGVEGYFYLFLNGGATPLFYYGYGDKKLTEGVPCENVSEFTSQFHEWRLGPTEARVDDLVVATFSGAVSNASATANICLPFRAAGVRNHREVTKTGVAEVKGAKIWEGGEIVRDFVPCVKDGVPQFYDHVRGGYYPSVTSKPFAAGEIVAPDGDFVSWSSACSLASGFTVIFR